MAAKGSSSDTTAILALRAKGMGWKAIGASLGLTGHRARMLVDPDYAERHRIRNYNRKEYGFNYRGVVPGMDRVSEPDVMARLAEIPPDTRSLTARILGDPLPGRRALDRVAR